MAQTADIRKQIEAAEERFVYLYNAHKSSDLASLYTDDAQILADFMDVVTGRSNIEALFQAFWKEAPTIRLVTREVEGDGDTAYEVGEFSLLDPHGAQADRGKYIVIWRNKDEQWKLHRDIFNTSLPKPTPANAAPGS